jgi:hypothetical protein
VKQWLLDVVQQMTRVIGLRSYLLIGDRGYYGLREYRVSRPKSIISSAYEKEKCIKALRVVLKS